MTLPLQDCSLCPRLVQFRTDNQVEYPEYFNGAVPSFGSLDSNILLVGLAPGLKGANQTGRPFTGDYAGDVLYESLKKSGFATGNYAKHKNDGFKLHNIRITNAVRCVPPQNKPEADEVNQCNKFLREEMQLMPNLKLLITLGGISHKAVIKMLELKQKDHPFKHTNEHSLNIEGRDITLLNTYHCSRYNINTKRLTQDMFDKIIDRAKVIVV